MAEHEDLTANRFTDFLVNEIQKNGEVLHLTDYNLGPRPTDTVSYFIVSPLSSARNTWLTSKQDVHIPGKPHQNAQNGANPAPAIEAQASSSDAASVQVSDEDLKILCDLLSEPTTQALKELFERIGTSGNSRLDIRANSVKFPPMERSQRGKVHQVRISGLKHAGFL